MENPEFAACKQTLLQVEWSDKASSSDGVRVLDEVETYLELKEQIQSGEKLDKELKKDDGAEPVPEKVVEGVVRRGLRDMLTTASTQERKQRAELRQLEANISRLEAQHRQFQTERRSMLRNMAAGHLHRVGCPPAVTQDVQFGAVQDEELMLAACEKGAQASAFNDLYDALPGEKQGPEPWICTAEAAARPEKDLLGMCPGGKLHVNVVPLSDEDFAELTPQQFTQRAVLAGLMDKETAKTSMVRVTATANAAEEASEDAEKAKELKQAIESFWGKMSGISYRVQGARCDCSVCQYSFKMAKIVGELKEPKRKVGPLKENVKKISALVKRIRRLLKCFKDSQEEVDVAVDDPVFVKEETDEACFEGRQIQWYREAQQEWERLGNSLKADDFPLRIAFLDKSGSMGCDAVSYDVLRLALHNCIHPTSGTTLTFLCAAPGETQIVLRRPGDEPMEFNLVLGSATWFHDPIISTLQFLAPLIEKLDTDAFIKQRGEAPLQVLCLTDGMDNMSNPSVRTFAGLISKIKSIKGPTSEQKLFMPLAGPLPETGLTAKVPVWMCWVATGMGGSSLLGAKIPQEICIVDAVAAPSHQELEDFDDDEWAEDTQEAQEGDDDSETEERRSEQQLSVAKSTKASRARQRMRKVSVTGSEAAAAPSARSKWAVGHRVRVLSTAAGQPPKAGLVTKANELEDGSMEYDILFDDETKSTVSGSFIVGAPRASKSMLAAPRSSTEHKGAPPQHGLLARTAEPDAQRLQVLTVVNSVTEDMGNLMRSIDMKSNKVALEKATENITGSEEVAEEAAANLNGKVSEASQVMKVSKTARQGESIADPLEALYSILNVVGRGTSKLTPEDRVVAQRFVTVGLEMFVSGGRFAPAHAADQLGPYVGLTEAFNTRRIRLEPEEIEGWHDTLTKPLRDLCAALLEKGLVTSSMDDGIETMAAVQDARPCYMAAWRFFDPSITRAGMEDSLRRAVNRFQRLQPAFSFSSSRSRRSPSRGNSKSNPSSPSGAATGEPESSLPTEGASFGFSRPASGSSTDRGRTSLPPIATASGLDSPKSPSVILRGALRPGSRQKSGMVRSQSLVDARGAPSSDVFVVNGTGRRSSSITRLR